MSTEHAPLPSVRATRAVRIGRDRSSVPEGTVTLIGMWSGAVGFGAVVMDQLWGVDISGGSVERGNLNPDREAFGDLRSPSGRAEQMPSRPEVCGDAAEGRQEPLRMPRRFEAFHRPFALSGGLMRVPGAVVQIPRPPVLHRRHERAVTSWSPTHQRPRANLRRNCCSS